MEDDLKMGHWKFIVYGQIGTMNINKTASKEG